MNQTFDPITLIMIAAAVFIFFRLRGVLGQKTGHQDPFDPFKKRTDDGENQAQDNAQDQVKGEENAEPDSADQDDSNVIQMPGAKGLPEADKPDVWEGVAAKGSKVAAGLKKIQDQDSDFSAGQFLDGARAAYEMIVTGFANGDKKSLKSLLSKEVYSGFAAAIDDRKKQGMEMTTQFIGIEQANIVKAQLENTKALLTIKFVSELVSVVKDKSGDVVEGDMAEIQEITDIWTFERKLSSRDPNWRLAATDGDDA